MSDAPVRVLLVDDDEDDFVIARDLIYQIDGRSYQLEWVDNYDSALAAIRRREHDICLVDYRLNGRTGLELLAEAQAFIAQVPMILLTGQDDHEIDLQATKAGAADYLVKGQLTADKLERAIRYAIEGKRAGERLRRERDLISRIMETSPVGIVVADQAGRITFANHRAEEVLGLTREIVGQHRYSVLDWRVANPEGHADEERSQPLRQLLATGQPVQNVCHALSFPQDRRVMLSTNATPLLDAAGKIDGMVVTVEDITDWLALEAQLRQAQKMDSIGQLAAGVAHDINNILTIIQGHTGLLLQGTPAETSAARSLKQILAASDRAAGFIRHLLMFSRKQIFQTKNLDLNAVLRNLENMLPRMLGEQIVLQPVYQPDLPHIIADAGMMEQIVINLGVNARDAMPKGGRLVIETFAVDIPAAMARQNSEARAGHFVCLTVRDNGCGIERSLLPRIFEPFFTTKEIGKGTGLGLATVYGIVRQHQGWIEVESEMGQGTVFKIFLPAAIGKNPAAVAPGPPLAELVAGGHETILVVEDEPGLLALVSRVLEGYQYHVLTAGSGREALRVWEENAGRIDLLLTDMIMPGGISGGDLAAELKHRQPGLKVLFTSGYSAELTSMDIGQGKVNFLPKPYHPQQVARRIREIMDAARAQLPAQHHGDRSAPPILPELSGQTRNAAAPR